MEDDFQFTDLWRCLYEEYIIGFFEDIKGPNYSDKKERD